jgi:hypothetical protein
LWSIVGPVEAPWLVIWIDVLPEVLDELLAVDVVLGAGAEELEQAVSLHALDSVGTEEVADFTSRDPAIVVWTQVAECLADCAELLWCKFCNLPAHFAQFLLRGAGRPIGSISTCASAGMEWRHHDAR